MAAPRTRAGLILALGLVLGACGASPSPATSLAPSSAPSAGVSSSAAPSAGGGEIVPAPGSSSEVYEPNPGSIVVAIDPGHGGCLDWGVPNPWDNTVGKAEKAGTLAIGLALRDLLEEQGITVVMTRTDDSALAGDDYPQLGCNGPAWRDVDGDGEAGFEETGRTRTRDELQARIDLANTARADLLISIHVNSMTQDGVAFEIAATQTFYDDETPWGESGSGALARAVQERVVAALDGVARYERQDRGTQAVAYYMISRQWQDGDSCETPGDSWCKPHRGADLPTVLAEVGSMSLEAESGLLAADEGRRSVAAALYEAVRGWLGGRTLAARYDALLPGGEAGILPDAAPGQGPPFAAAEIRAADLASGALALRLTNTGTQPWAAGSQLLVGWSPSDAPYLADAPANLAPVETEVPALAPGESVTLHVPLELPSGARHVAWITLADPAGTPLTDSGTPPLQLATGPG